jgi:hypothetical protein
MSENPVSYEVQGGRESAREYLARLIESTGFDLPGAAFALEIDAEVLRGYLYGYVHIPRHIIFACERLEYMQSGKEPMRLRPR